MAGELETIDPPSWAPKPQQQLETIDPPSWATAPKPQRGVFQRAGEEAQATFESGIEAAKALARPLPKVEGEGRLGRAWRAAKTATAGVLSPLTITAGPVFSAAESLLSSGMGAVTNTDPLTGKPVKPGSEEAYEAAHPFASAITTVGTLPIGGARRVVVGPQLPKMTRTERAAAEEIERYASDPAKLKERLATVEEHVPGSQPTTFQATSDQGIGTLENTARLEEQEAFRQRAVEQNAARIRALEGVEPGGAPGDVASHLREAQRVEKEQAEQMVSTAEQRAREASQLPGGTYDPATYGNVFRHELERAHAAAKENEGNLYRAVDPNGVLQVNPQPIQEVERGIYGPHVMTQAGSASVTPAEKQISELISNYAPQGIPFRELRDLRSLTSSAMRAERDANRASPAYARLVQLRQGIEDALERSVTMPIPGGEVNVGDLAAQRLREASAATKQRKETFKPLEAVTRRETASGPYKMGESQVAGRIIQQGAKGYDSVSSYLRAVGNERGLPDVQDAIAASMRREAIGADGVVDPKALNTWLKKYQDTLRAIDERDGGAFSQTLRNAGKEQEGVAAARAGQKEVAARYEGKDELGQLIGARDDAHVTEIIGGMFDKTDSVKRVRDLLGKLTTPEAQAGARRAVLDYIQRRFLGTTQLGEDVLLRGGRFVEFMRRNASALRQVLPPDQINQLQAISKDLLRTSQTATGKAIPGASDTASLFTAMVQRGAGTVGKMMADILAHTVAGPAGSVAVRGAEAATKLYTGSQKAKARTLTNEAMLDPAKAQDLLRRRAAAGTPRPPLKRPITGAALTTGTLTGDRNYQRKKPQEERRLPRQTGGYVPIAGLSGARPRGAQAPAPTGGLRARPSQALSHARAPRFQAGGEISRYDTPLKPGEETAFQFWKRKYAPEDSGEDYDFRGAWKAGIKPDPQSGHWPDTYKKPNHPTFSNESQYAKDAPDRAGRWEGETYIPPGRADGGDVADASRAQEPFIDPMSGAPATPESLRTIGRGVYNTVHGLLVDLPERFMTRVVPKVMSDDPDEENEIGRGVFDVMQTVAAGPKPTGAIGAAGGRMPVARLAPTVREGTAPVACLVQRASPEEITRAAQTSHEMTYPQLRQLYRELGLTGGEPSEVVRPALRPQPMEAIGRATELKLADQRVLDTLTEAERRTFQLKGKLPEGVILPSQEAAAPAERAMEPTWKEVAKAQEAYKQELAAGRGTSIFDVSPEALLRQPDVPQFVLPRTVEKRTERLAPAFAGGAGLRRLESAAGAAAPRTWGWYNIQEPIRTFSYLHSKYGPEIASAWLDALAGTSMVNPISSNVRGSSWYLNQILGGKPLPQVILVKDPVSGKTLQALAGPPPAGYGAKAQVHHAQRVREFLGNEADPVENMKPMSYRANLGGNYLPRTVDTHDIRNMVGMPYATEKPMTRALLPGEYVALENLGRQASQRAGVPQAMQQAGTWIGGGPYTRLKSIPIPLAEELSRRSHITGMVRGIRPEEAWRRHVTGV